MAEGALLLEYMQIFYVRGQPLIIREAGGLVKIFAGSMFFLGKTLISSWHGGEPHVSIFPGDLKVSKALLRWCTEKETTKYPAKHGSPDL